MIRGFIDIFWACSSNNQKGRGNLLSRKQWNIDLSILCRCYMSPSNSLLPWTAYDAPQNNWNLNSKQQAFSYFSPSEAEKIDFSFIWKKLNSNIKPNVSIKKYLKSVKAPELFRKTYFQIKVNKSGRCHNLRPGQVPWGNFCCNCSCWGLIFMLFSYFVYILHFTKFTHGSSLFMEKSLLMEKSKAEESPWKKKIKNRPKLRKKGYHSVK